MVIKTLNDAVRVANLCEQYPDLEIDAKCEKRRYIVDAKSMMGLTLMIDGGEVYFRVIDTNKPGYDSFMKELGELDIEFENR